MAVRSDQIKIFLSTVGASRAKREIDSLADSLDRLTEAEDKKTGTSRESAAATKEEVKATEAHAKELRAEAANTNAVAKVEHERTQQMKADTRERIQHENNETRQKVANARASAAASNSEAKIVAENEKTKRAEISLTAAESRQSIQDSRERIAQGKQETAIFQENERTKRQEQRITHKKTTEEQRQVVRNIQSVLSSVEEYRKQATKTYREVNTVIKDNERLLKDVERFEEKTEVNRVKRHNRELRRLKQLSTETKRAWRDIGRAFGGGGGGMRGYTMLIALLITLLPMIATAANAAAAGILALANGFINLSGVLGVIPAGMMAAAQGVAVFSMAFKGLGKAMTDQNAFALLGPQAQNLVLAINDLRQPFGDLRNNVRETLLNGIGRDILKLGNYYLPMLNVQLANTARRANVGLHNFTGWLGSGEGRSTMTGLASTGSVVVGNGVDAGQRLLQVFLMIANAAGPMIREMSQDLVTASHQLDNWVFNNQGGIAAFFMRGYHMFQGALSTISDYGHGLYNIIKLSSPLTDHILNAIEKTGVRFREWTSGEGVPKIKQYFKDMQPDLDMLAHLAGSFATAIFSMANNKGFQDFVQVLADKTLPAAADALNQVASSGFLTALANTIAMTAHLIDLIAKVFGALPGFIQQGLVYAIAIKAALNIAIPFIARLVPLPGAIGTILGGRAAAGGIAGGIGGAGGAAAGGMGAAGAGAAGASGGLLARTGLGAAGAGATGAMAALGPIAIAGGIAVGIANLLNNFLKGTGQTNQTQGALMNAAQGGNLDKFFQNQNGRGVLRWQDLGGGRVNDLQSALEQYQSNTGGWRNAGNAWLSHHLPTWLGGGLSNQEKVAKTFQPLDQSLANLARSGSAEQAAKDFDQIKQMAAKAHMPMSELLRLFPQYNAYLEQQKHAVDTPGVDPQKVTGTPPRTYMDQAGKTHRLAGIDQYGRPYGGGAFFAGGVAPAGFMSLAGELGPELAMTRAGGFGLLGLNGPELFKPSSDTAIIPASATSDPLGGNYGNAPDWARNALQSAVDAPMRRRVAPRTYKDSEAPVTYSASISLGGTQLSEAQITAAVMAGLKKAERDRKERR